MGIIFCFHEQGVPLIISSKDTCLIEITLLGSAESDVLQSECIEEVVSNLSPKAGAVEEVSNESVVQEAWQVVNENFLDARQHSWSADEWLVRCISSIAVLIYLYFLTRSF